MDWHSIHNKQLDKQTTDHYTKTITNQRYLFMKKIILVLCTSTLLNYAQIVAAAAAKPAVPGEDNRDRSAASTGMSLTVGDLSTLPEAVNGTWVIDSLGITRFFFKALTQEKSTDAQTLRDIKHMVQNSMKLRPDVFYLYLPDCNDPKIENCRTISNLDTSEEPVLGAIYIPLSHPDVMEELNKVFKENIWPREKSCLLQIQHFKTVSPPKFDQNMHSLFTYFFPDNTLPCGIIHNKQRVNLRVLEEEGRKLEEIEEGRRLLKSINSGEHAADQLKSTVKVLEEGLLLLFISDQLEITRQTLKGQNLTPIEKDFNNWLLLQRIDRSGNIIVFFLPPQCKGNAEEKITHFMYTRFGYFQDYSLHWKGINDRDLYFYSIYDIELFNKNFFKQYRDDQGTLHSSDSVATSSAGA